MKLLALECPAAATEKTPQFTVDWLRRLGGTSAQASFHHTRAPQTPRGVEKAGTSESKEVRSYKRWSASNTDRTRRGVWGARVEMKLLALECPPAATEKTPQFTVDWLRRLGGTSAQPSFRHTRAPQTPRGWLTALLAEISSRSA